MVGLSLLVACAYLAMLASGRALARRRELAVRMALGASRRRMAMQLTWESVLLAAAGSGLGILFAWAAQRGLLALMRTMGDSNPGELRAGPGGMVLLFTLGLAAHHRDLLRYLAGVAGKQGGSRQRYQGR